MQWSGSAPMERMVTIIIINVSIVHCLLVINKEFDLKLFWFPVIALVLISQ
jgi:hypothetical protein